jgi:Xaa-Pro aminopeptidase
MPTEVLADDAALRSARRARAFAAMESHGIDALLLGREANARYVAGAPRLWTAGTRPYGPGCVLVRSTGAVHLVSTWDEGMPEDIPHEHLFGITWNPGNLFAWLRGIEGMAEARRIGTDSLTPRFAQVLPKIFPDAELVDAEPALEAARRVKAPEELAAIRSALTVAEAALAAAVAELGPGVAERHLAAVFMDAMARHGVTTPATQRVAWVASEQASPGRRGDRTVARGDFVTFDAGVVAGGYTGELGRTWPADPGAVDDGQRLLAGRAEDLHGRLVDACRPGATGADLLAAYDAAGCALPPWPVAWGLGLGFDAPVVTGQLPRTAREEVLVPGMVLAVTACARVGARTFTTKDAVLVTDGAPEILSSAPRWQA